MVTVPLQLSPVEVAVPVLLGAVDSPQASSLSAGQLMFGAVVSAVQVAVRETVVAALPQASVPFHVRVCERAQPVLLTVLSVKFGAPTLQLSVALALPRAASISAAVGLQPKAPFPGVPVAVITGAIRSSVQV